MSTLYFVEKFSQAKMVAEVVAEKGDIFVVLPTISGYKFKYSSELSYKNFPIIEENYKYKANKENTLFEYPIKEFDGVSLVELRVQPLQELNQFKSNPYKEFLQIIATVKELFEKYPNWVLATDADHSGVRGFDLFFEVFLNQPISSFKYKTLKRANFYSLEESEIKKAIMNADNIDVKTRSKDTVYHYDKCKSAYKNKDFFDYNFNINSLLTFNDTLSLAGAYRHNFVFTHFMLKTILLIKENGTLKVNDLHSKLSQNEIGSPASRHEIIESIYKLGLIEKRIRANQPDKFALTEEGELFASMIHNKINSLNTKKIIEDINNLEHKEFKNKYSIKLSEFFKKQRNFVRSKMLEDLIGKESFN